MICELTVQDRQTVSDVQQRLTSSVYNSSPACMGTLILLLTGKPVHCQPCDILGSLAPYTTIANCTEDYQVMLNAFVWFGKIVYQAALSAAATRPNTSRFAEIKASPA